MLAFNIFIFQTVLIGIILCQIKIPVTLVTLFGGQLRTMFNLRYDINFSSTVLGTTLESESTEPTTTDYLNLSTFDPTIPSVNTSLDTTTAEIEGQLETYSSPAIREAITTPQINLRHDNDEVTINPSFLRMLPTPSQADTSAYGPITFYPILRMLPENEMNDYDPITLDPIPSYRDTNEFFELITFENPILRMAPIPKEIQADLKKIPLPSASVNQSSKFNTIMELYTNISQQMTLSKPNSKKARKNPKKPVPHPEPHSLLSDQKTNNNTVTKTPRKKPTKSKKSLSTTTRNNSAGKTGQVKVDNQNKIVNKSATSYDVKKNNAAGNNLGDKSKNATTKMPKI